MTIYAGTKGYLDTLAVDQVRPFLEGLRDYMKTNKPDFSKNVLESSKMSPEDEEMLKEGLLHILLCSLKRQSNYFFN